MTSTNQVCTIIKRFVVNFILLLFFCRIHCFCGLYYLPFVWSVERMDLERVVAVKILLLLLLLLLSYRDVVLMWWCGIKWAKIKLFFIMQLSSSSRVRKKAERVTRESVKNIIFWNFLFPFCCCCCFSCVVVVSRFYRWIVFFLQVVVVSWECVLEWKKINIDQHKINK